VRGGADHVNPLHRDPCTAQQSVRELARMPRQRVDGAVMIRIGVHVEHSRATRKRIAHGGDRPLLAAL